jgi:acyl carrier protein
MSIEETIRQFIVKNLYFVEDARLGNDVSFLAEGIIDSMGAMELVAFVESEFGVKVDMSEVVVKNFDSISSLATFVRRKLGLDDGEYNPGTSAETIATSSGQPQEQPRV